MCGAIKTDFVYRDAIQALNVSSDGACVAVLWSDFHSLKALGE